MKVLLFQLDGSLPNVALMRIAAHHRQLGDAVELRYATTVERVQRRLQKEDFGAVYASAIFQKTRPVAEAVGREWPGAVIGGTGVDVTVTLEQYGIETDEQDYSIYPSFTASMDFTKRGCRLRCSFCVVPQKEGAVRENRTIADIWRGEPWPRHLLLLDNDFFGLPTWRERIAEIRDGDFKVCFTQGVNARMLTDEAAEAIASVDYRDSSFRDRRIYTAWDNRRDEGRLFEGLRRLLRHGVRPRHVMVYVLIGYDHTRRQPCGLTDDDFYRLAQLRAFGAIPYPMPFVRSRELVGFQRWVIGNYDKRVSWSRWAAARYQPRQLGVANGSLFPTGVGA